MKANTYERTPEMKIIQRLGSGAQYKKEYIDGLLRLKKKYPKSYNTVWLATDYGFPSLSVHEEHAKTLAGIADRFRKAGVTVSLQLSNSIGHGQYMSSEDCSGLVYDGSPVRPMTGHDGTVSQYCFCFRGKEFADYVTKELSLYCKSIRPETVWFDDDFRADNHAPVKYGCFCDSCLARFNSEQGTSYTREALVGEILNGDGRVREAFVCFNRRDLGVLAEKMAKAVSDASPETSIALQNGFHAYTGGDFDFFFNSVRPYSKNAPAYRGGGGAYNDHNPSDIFLKVTHIMAQNSYLPDYVTLRVPEIENLPFDFSGKSPAGDMLESALELAAGHTGLSYSMMMRFEEEPEYYGKHLALLDKMVPYFEKLAEVSGKTRAGGICYALPGKPYLRKLGADEGFDGISFTDIHSADPIMRDGVPITFEDNGGVIMLTRENAVAMTDGELEALLSRSVITDGQTIGLIQARGYDLGIEPRMIDASVAGRFHEKFTDDPLNPKGKDHLSVSFFVPGGSNPRYTFDRIPDNSRVLGYYESNVDVKTDRAPTVANFIFKTPQGGTFAVFGYGLNVGIVPKYAIDRLTAVCDFISEKKLPAVLISESQAYLYPRVNTEGKTVSVSVANATPGADKIVISLRDPVSTSFVFRSQYGKDKVLTATEKDGEYFIKLPLLPAYSVGTVFCE